MHCLMQLAILTAGFQCEIWLERVGEWTNAYHNAMQSSAGKQQQPIASRKTKRHLFWKQARLAFALGLAITHASVLLLRVLIKHS